MADATTGTAETFAVGDKVKTPEPHFYVGDKIMEVTAIQQNGRIAVTFTNDRGEPHDVTFRPDELVLAE